MKIVWLHISIAHLHYPNVPATVHGRVSPRGDPPHHEVSVDGNSFARYLKTSPFFKLMFSLGLCWSNWTRFSNVVNTPSFFLIANILQMREVVVARGLLILLSLPLVEDSFIGLAGGSLCWIREGRFSTASSYRQAVRFKTFLSLDSLQCHLFVENPRHEGLTALHVVTHQWTKEHWGPWYPQIHSCSICLTQCWPLQPFSHKQLRVNRLASLISIPYTLYHSGTPLTSPNYKQIKVFLLKKIMEYSHNEWNFE